MHIVMPGALPPLAVAAELARLLPEHAPTLHGWLQSAPAELRAHDVRALGCTAFESWQLGRLGYRPEAGLLQSAGLGPLLADDTAGHDPVWLAELVHLALGTDQAALLDPALMDLRPEESEALLATAQTLFQGTGFTAQALTPARWRLRLPAGLRPATASPLAVAGQRLQAWWSQDAAMRPWRRLLNEIQMVWHEHPVNEARAARGAPPVNGLWLYGGGKPWKRAEPAPARILDDLDGPARAGDWAAWLRALAALDRRHLRPLAGPKGPPAETVELLLLGEDRMASLALKPRAGLLGLLPSPKKNWSAWWSHPA